MMRTDLNLQVAVSAALRAALARPRLQIAVSTEDGDRPPERRCAHGGAEAWRRNTPCSASRGCMQSSKRCKVVTNAGAAVTDETLAQDAVQALATGRASDRTQCHHPGRERMADAWRHRRIGGRVCRGRAGARVPRRGSRDEERSAITGTPWTARRAVLPHRQCSGLRWVRSFAGPGVGGVVTSLYQSGMIARPVATN